MHLFPGVALRKQGLQSPKHRAFLPKAIQAGGGVPTTCTGVPHPMLIHSSTSRATCCSVATEADIAAARHCSSHHLSWPCSSLLMSGHPVTACSKVSPAPGFPVCCHKTSLAISFVLAPSLPGGPHKWNALLGKPCPCSAACERFGLVVQSLLLGQSRVTPGAIKGSRLMGLTEIPLMRGLM